MRSRIRPLIATDMKQCKGTHFLSRQMTGCLVWALMVGTANAATNLDLSFSGTLKEGFDSNVYLQDKDPTGAIPGAVRPFQQSFITSVTPQVGLDYNACTSFTAVVNYAPEVTFYHAEPSENHVSHRGLLNLSGKIDRVPWKCDNTFLWIQGSEEGPTFGGPNGAKDSPSIGGIPIRDRRAQFVYRGKLQAIIPWAKWFFRPAASGYWHDFFTDQKDPTVFPGYENYIDRREFNAGIDIGHQVGEQTRVFVGYRYGQEIQGHVPGSPYHYDSEYHRATAGVEGTPANWLKVQFNLGPDIHHTIHEPDPRFDPCYTTLWVDGVITALPSKKDSITFTWRQNTQPAFASTSVYDDIVYDLTARHAFNDRWSAGLGGRLYRGNWFEPVNRDDFIYTITATAGCNITKKLRADLTYSYDTTESKTDPAFPYREYTRHLAWLSVQYRF